MCCFLRICLEIAELLNYIPTEASVFGHSYEFFVLPEKAAKKSPLGGFPPLQFGVLFDKMREMYCEKCNNTPS